MKVLLHYRTSYGSTFYASHLTDDYGVTWSAVPSEAIPIDKSLVSRISMRTPVSFDTEEWTPALAENLSRMSASRTFHYPDLLNYTPRNRLKSMCGRFVGSTEVTTRKENVTCYTCKKKLQL